MQRDQLQTDERGKLRRAVEIKNTVLAQRKDDNRKRNRPDRTTQPPQQARQQHDVDARHDKREAARGDDAMAEDPLPGTQRIEEQRLIPGRILGGVGLHRAADVPPRLDDVVRFVGPGALPQHSLDRERDPADQDGHQDADAGRAKASIVARNVHEDICSRGCLAESRVGFKPRSGRPLGHPQRLSV